MATPLANFHHTVTIKGLSWLHPMTLIYNELDIAIPGTAWWYTNVSISRRTGRMNVKGVQSLLLQGWTREGIEAFVSFALQLGEENNGLYLKITSFDCRTGEMA